MIELTDVTLRYKSGVEGLSELSLLVEDGELCFITGGSGSGKSTLSKLLTGELLPTAGSVKVNGYLMSSRKLSNKTRAEARRTIGMVFQDYRLIENMTVDQNLEFAMHCVGAAPETIEKRIPEVLQLVEMSNMGNRYPSELSGGEQQRIAIARAIINHPSVIIADEPTGSLDPFLSKEIMDLFYKINQFGTTIIIISHDIALIKCYNRRIISIANGKIAFEVNRHLR